MAGLARDLSDAENPLAKCMQRLRVRLNKVQISQGDDVAVNTMESLLEMLNVNKRLEYLDIVAPLMHFDRESRLDKHHNEILYRLGKPLPSESKAAFLSTLALRQNVSEPCLKRASEMTPAARRAAADLDEHVIRKIFVFAGFPVFRKTYLRLAEDDDFNGESNEIHV